VTFAAQPETQYPNTRNQLEAAEHDSIQKVISHRLGAAPRRYSALRMAPMIDMIFLLLIFFLVAAKWRPAEDFLPFQLGAAQARPAGLVKPEPLIIQITATQTGCIVQIGQSQTVSIEDRTIAADLVTLTEKLQEALVLQKRYGSDPVEIVCSPELKWEHLAKVYNTFYGAGLTDITFRMTE
jgi:biopolymer transport protein ExbD